MEHNKKWLIYCKLTAVGGSECGECGCYGPRDCELQQHADFKLQRNLATKRMTEHFAESLDPVRAKLLRRLIRKAAQEE